MANDLNLKLISNNVRGLHDFKKRQTYFHWLNSNKIDIACIQETFCTQNFEKEFNRIWDGKIIHCFTDSPHSRGVGIIFRNNLDFSIISTHRQTNGRTILLQIRHGNENITICNIYAPNKMNDRIKYFNNLLIFIKNYISDDSILILCGDMNTHLYKYNAITAGNNAESQLTKIINQLQLIDCSQMRGDNNDSTYIKPGNANIQSHIDYILVSKKIEQYIKYHRLRVAPVPDHKAIEIQIIIKVHERGRCIWKLNTSFLNEEQYVEEISQIIKSTLHTNCNSISKRQSWDLCKVRIKEFSISYGKRRTKQKKQTKINLENEINRLDKKIISTQISTIKKQLANKREELKKKLDVFQHEQAIGSQIRSKAEWVEKGEKNTSYFLNLEKYRQSKNAIYTLKQPDGSLVDTKNEVLCELLSFYKTLYTSKMIPTDTTNSYFIDLENATLPKLSKSESKLCDGYVTVSECTNVLYKIKPNKSPGSDGLSIELYQKFWPLIKKHLVESFNEGFDNNNLSDSQNIAILSLMHKKGDPQELKNYRPISLLNTDYKLLTHVLAARMHTILHRIINPDQNGYVKARFIGYNIRLVEDILYYNNKYSHNSFLSFIDFEKAFDSIEIPFIIRSLEFLKFNNQFIRWIQTIYSEPRIMIKNNGWLSSSFVMKRGVRQGCPISSLLFIIGTEMLAHKIRLNTNIHGIQIGSLCGSNNKNEVKLIQYADDTILLGVDESSLKCGFDEIKYFTNIAGPKLNLNKTEIIATHELRKKNVLCGIQIKETINCLGIHIGHSEAKCQEKNWTEKISNIEKILCQWSKRNLTIFGKILVIKSLALSKITYSAMNTHIPDNIIKKLNSIVFKFVWNNKERIKRSVLIGKFENGGAEMIHIESHFNSLKASWVKRIINSNSTWSIIGQNIINQFGGKDLLLRCNDSTLNYLNTIPPFYAAVFQAFIKINTKQINDIGSLHRLLNEPIWCNCNIQYKNKTLYYRSWIDSNIIYIKDLHYIAGKLNEKFVYNKIANKRNLWMEVFQLKNALSRYKKLLTNFSFSNEDKLIPPITSLQLTTKEIYNIYITSIYVKPEMKILQTRPSLANINITDIANSFLYRVKYMKDKKLAEFNFKVLHNTLVNGVYLSKWLDESRLQCSFCQTEDDIIHMLYDCKINDNIWKIVGNNTKTNILVKHVIIGNSPLNTKNNKHIVYFNHCITIIAFIIYKYWLMTINNDEKKNEKALHRFMSTELNNKIKILRIYNYPADYAILNKINNELKTYISLHYDPG